MRRAPSETYTFQAVPFDGLSKRLAHLRGATEFPILLRKIIAAARNRKQFHRGAGRLFRDMALVDVAAAAEVLRSMLATASADDILFVAELIAALPSNVVLEQIALLTEVLAAATGLDPASCEGVQRVLSDALIPSAWQSVVGEPDPNHVAAMERAKAIVTALSEGGSPERTFLH